MLVNNTGNNYDNHVEFISYTGRYPNLCSGILTLKIDGKEVTFGSSWQGKVDYDKFWHSGGGIDHDYCAYSGEWEINVQDLPEEYRKYATEIDDVFNSNVWYGCCGGCI